MGAIETLSTLAGAHRAPALTLAADAAPLMLLSPWKPFLVLLPLLAWAYVVSSIYDKDAKRWYFKHRLWNTAHVGAATVGLAIVLLAPVTFWVTWPVMLGILAADLAAYFVYHNRHSQVPESQKWTLDFSKLAESRAQRKKASKAASTTLVFQGPGGALPVPEKETADYDVRVAAEELIKKMLDARASQMDIFPVKEGMYGATALVDGMRHAIEQLPPAKAVAVIDLYKAAAGLDIKDRRRRQRGEMKVGQSGASLMPVGVTTLGTSAGMRIELLVDPIKQVSMRVGELGLHPNQLEDLKRLVAQEESGVVLVAAMPDGGRTATLYALVREHDAYTSNVQVVEMETQAQIEGVRHNLFDPQKDGSEYSTLVRSILRRDPDVVAIAEVDEETVKEVSRADVEHTRIYLSMKADDPLKAIQLFAQMVGDQKKAASCLHGVVAVKLARRLCHNCKIGVQPTPENLKKLGLPPDTKQLFRKSGKVLVKDKEQTCPVCNGVGYFGQIGVFAVHTLGSEERQRIAQNDLSGLRAVFRQNKQQSIQQAALQHVLKGETSVEEVLRITASTKKGAAPAEKGRTPEAAA